MLDTFTEQLIGTNQERMAALGYYVLNIDGLEGVGTRNAFTRFKEVNGFRARPYPGILTLTRLFSEDALPAPKLDPKGKEPLWLQEARQLIGVRETPGAANNPIIMNWARNLDQWYPGDDTPWCGLFVAHCTAKGAPSEPQDFNRLGARAWDSWGVDASKTDIPLGAVCTLWRTHPTQSWNGHVFIATGQNKTAIRGIGGNQSDMVSEMWFERDRLLSVNVPFGYNGPSCPIATTGKLSQAEV